MQRGHGRLSGGSHWQQRPLIPPLEIEVFPARVPFGARAFSCLLALFDGRAHAGEQTFARGCGHRLLAFLVRVLDQIGR